jgi:glycosyltransferase involved in cell wall biosynthesis
MTLIFWQGMISIHQKTFLEALAKQPAVSKVMMVVETDITPYRKGMGWEVPEVKNVEIILSPTRQKIDEIFRQNGGAVHVLGGVRVGKMMTQVFKTGVKYGAKMGSLSEPYDRIGFKGKLRTLKYMFHKAMYYRHIDFFLAVGKEGVRTYKGLGFDASRVFPWAYFVSVKAEKAIAQSDNVKRIIYAGRIEEAKGISRFVSELARKKNAPFTLDIYGGGPQEESLKKFVEENGLSSKVHFRPFMKYSDLIRQYASHDWVVLPSIRKDGWGVIVSEGMLNGLKAICSSICGVSWAVKDHFNGVVFDWNEEGSCEKAIDALLHDDSFAGSHDIQRWAENSVSAEAGAKYYLKILDGVYNGKPMPDIPWN